MADKIDVQKYRDMVNRSGKFEGEYPECPYYYERWLNGDGEYITDQDGDELIKLSVTDEEANAFGLDVDTVYLYEDRQGFVYLWTQDVQEAE